MFLGILTLITALSISAVAIYYSVAGLMTIFAAAAVPIMIMGGTLEIAKLVTAVWLHRYWNQATWWLKTYLTTAVVILMFITSMGIFGFLSKAHIEQTAQSTDNLAQVETIQSEIDRNLAIIGRAENKIRELDNSQSNTDTTIQDQIDREQERIDTAYDRVQPLVDEQNRSLDDQIALFGLDKVDAKIASLNEAMNIDTKDRESVRFLQSMVGARPDGAYGSGTAAKVEEYRSSLNAERDRILEQIQTVRTATNEEIARIRKGAEDQIAESNRLINRLREQLGAQDNTVKIQTAIDEQNERVRTASSEIDRLTEEKIALESEYRKLEAEVGPVKYIAEFIYGERADTNLLEEAVRWVILIIIFVFDPLAVLLLIASQYTFELNRKRKDDQKELHRQQSQEEYERTRAKHIIDNPGYNIDNATPPEEEKVDDDNVHREAGTGYNGGDTSIGMALASQGEVDVATEKESTEDTTEDTVGDGPTPGENSEDTQSVPVEQEDHLTQDEKSKIASAYIDDVETKKKDIELQEEFEEDEILEERKIQWQAKESDVILDDAKTQWKIEHPNETIKFYKSLYLKGKIDELPWENDRYKPNLTEVVEPEGYIQNSEQNERTLFNRLRREQN